MKRFLTLVVVLALALVAIPALANQVKRDGNKIYISFDGTTTLNFASDPVLGSLINVPVMSMTLLGGGSAGAGGHVLVRNATAGGLPFFYGYDASGSGYSQPFYGSAAPSTLTATRPPTAPSC